MAKITETINLKGILDIENLTLEGNDGEQDLKEYLAKYDSKLVSITIKVQKED